MAKYIVQAWGPKFGWENLNSKTPGMGHALEGMPTSFATRKEAERAIRMLRTFGPEWRDSDYRVVVSGIKGSKRKARLDTKGTARPRSKIVGRFREGHVIGPMMSPPGGYEYRKTGRDPKPKKERYRMAYKHKTSFHRLGEGIIGRTTGSELHLASAESWREQASRTDDPKRKREFLAHARAHEKRAGSQAMQKSHRRVLEGQLWKVWPKEYKFIMNRVRAIRMKTRDGYEDKKLQYLTDDEIMHLLHPARRDLGSRRSTEIVPESARHRRVYFEKGAAWSKSTWRPGYYTVVSETTKPGMSLIDEERLSRAGERAYALAKTPRGGALWVLAKNTRPVRQRRA